MASQSLSTSNYNLHNINHSSEPGQAQALLLNAPPSPPPTLKKSVFIFSPISSHNREPQTRIRRCGLIAQQPFHLAKQTGVKWFWVLVGLLGVFCWWKSGNVEDLENLRHQANEMTKSLLLLPVLDGMHFTPATNQHIRVSH